MKLYFKHLLPMATWYESPFSPWEFGEGVFFSVLSFMESVILDDLNFNLKKILQCDSIFMDSGAFAATSMGFQLDPYEVAELQARLKADLVVPLDEVILPEDSKIVQNQKIRSTLQNTEILLDYIDKTVSQVVGTLHGTTPEQYEIMFDTYRSLGIKHFAQGGLVFSNSLSTTLKRIIMARELTKGSPLHIFGKFLHPSLLKLIIGIANSVDGYDYLSASIKGKYIDVESQKYVGIGKVYSLTCECPVCQVHTLIDLQRADTEAQMLLIQHNILSLIELKKRYMKEVLKK